MAVSRAGGPSVPRPGASYSGKPSRPRPPTTPPCLEHQGSADLSEDGLAQEHGLSSLASNCTLLPGKAVSWVVAEAQKDREARWLLLLSHVATALQGPTVLSQLQQLPPVLPFWD